MNSDIKLLPRDCLVKTNPLDKAEWNYSSLLGRIQRRRFRLAASLLQGTHVERLLEIGYGSGVFMLELQQHCDELYGVDRHEEQKAVESVLVRHGVKARLTSSPAGALPFEDHFFDCVVAVSVLEFIEDLDATCAEIRRVLKPNSTFIVITPGHSPAVDFGLWALTGSRASEEYGARRQRVIPTLLKYFALERRLNYPILLSPVIRLYSALRLRVRS